MFKHKKASTIKPRKSLNQTIKLKTGERLLPFDKTNYQTSAKKEFNVSVQIEESSKYQTCKSNMLKTMPTKPIDALQAVMTALSEIKSQNQALLEKQEQFEADIQQQINEQTRDLRREIQMLKSNNKRIVKSKKVTQPAKRRFFTTNVIQAVQSEETNQNRIAEDTTTSSHLFSRAEGTGLSKVLKSEPEQSKEDPMRMSMGSKLLEMIQHNQNIKGQHNKVIKNFNFKLNINEIDKILEEEDDEKVEVKEQKKQPFRRQRWGQKPAAIGGRAQRSRSKASIERKQQKPQRIGIKTKAPPAFNTSSEDPILNLLRQEQEEESKQEEVEQQTKAPLEDVIEEDDTVLTSEISPRPQQENNEGAFQISPRLDCKENQVKRPMTADQSKLPPKKGMTPKRFGGLFRAPPKDAIDNILNGDNDANIAKIKTKIAKKTSPIKDLVGDDEEEGDNPFEQSLRTNGGLFFKKNGAGKEKGGTAKFGE